jgi:hypothetical protein
LKCHSAALIGESAEHAPSQNASEIAIETNRGCQQFVRELDITMLALEKAPSLQQLGILLSERGHGLVALQPRNGVPQPKHQPRSPGLECCTRCFDSAKAALQQRFEHERSRARLWGPRRNVITSHGLVVPPQFDGAVCCAMKRFLVEAPFVRLRTSLRRVLGLPVCDSVGQTAIQINGALDQLLGEVSIAVLQFEQAPFVQQNGVLPAVPLQFTQEWRACCASRTSPNTNGVTQPLPSNPALIRSSGSINGTESAAKQRF